MHAAPAVSRALCAKQKTHTSIQVQRRQSGIPCAVVLRLISRSPRGPGFLAPVVGVMRSIIANLTPASGRRDHATSPYARHAVRRSARPRPPQSRLAFRDDRDTPLASSRDARIKATDLPDGATEILPVVPICRRPSGKFPKPPASAVLLRGPVAGATRGAGVAAPPAAA